MTATKQSWGEAASAYPVAVEALARKTPHVPSDLFQSPALSQQDCFTPFGMELALLRRGLAGTQR